MKTAFITGGNRGIGLETARQLGKLQYRVIIGCRNENAGKEAVRQLQEEGAIADYVVMDVANEKSVQAAAAEVAQKCQGYLDVLINNAGYASPWGGSYMDNLAELRKCYEINVLGTVCVTNHLLDLVKRAPAGRIVNVSSILGSIGTGQATISSLPYNASKAALNMFTANLAAALKDTKIKVNSAHPGWVKTDMGGPDAELSKEEGAETSVYLATLPEDGPTGGFFFKRDPVPW